MKQLSFRLFFCSIIIFVHSCATTGFIERQETAKKIAEDAGFHKVVFDTGLFNVSGWEKIIDLENDRTQASGLMVVYIEGDGRAWESRHKVSKNPTPINPLALRLAVQERRPYVLYLGRPCQFVRIKKGDNCQEKYWTSHRYSQDIINAYHALFEQLKEKKGVQRFELVGFSGGGVVAALLAAQRKDIDFITTIASNLDHFFWADYHKVTPLNGSLDVFSYISGLSDVSQYHLWGANDSIVPFALNKKILNQLLNNTNVSYEVYENFNHYCCWVEHWTDIQTKRIRPEPE